MKKQQEIFCLGEEFKELDTYLYNHKCIFLVCGNSFQSMSICKYFEKLKKTQACNIVEFNEFQANPEYDSVVKGVELFHKSKADVIVAIGGGSAIDVAKCIKLFSNMNDSCNYLEQDIITNEILLLAVPTTAGTGTEATKYAVIYYNGEKQSITNESCIPQVVIFVPTLLKSLPVYQRKCTMMDALCHAIEAYWSINSTPESREYSRTAIQMILSNKEAYLKNSDSGNMQMLIAANIAGKAINIAQTTAGHAMSYKLTSLYGIAHGHAAAMCVCALFPYMIQNVDKCVDPRGTEHFSAVLKEMVEAFGCDCVEEMVNKYSNIIKELNLPKPLFRSADFKELVTSVNPVRLKNNPIFLELSDIEKLYHVILGGIHEG